MKQISTNDMIDNNEIKEFQKYVHEYNVQQKCLGVLNQLIYIIDERPCSFELLGMDIDRNTITKFIAGLVVGKIVSIMFSSIIN